MRLAKLIATASLRRAGLAPWLIAIGWLGLAAAQEPRMLRSFGVHLTSQAAAAACLAVVLVHSSGLRPVRRVAPYLLANTIVVALCTAVFTIVVVLLEEVRRAPWEAGGLFLGALVQASLQMPLMIAISLSVSTRNLLVAGFAIGVAALTLSLSVQLHTGKWSTAQTTASMALFASAAALANVHCHKKI